MQAFYFDHVQMLRAQSSLTELLQGGGLSALFITELSNPFAVNAARPTDPECLPRFKWTCALFKLNKQRLAI